MIQKIGFAIFVFFVAVACAQPTCFEAVCVIAEIDSPQADEGLVVRGQTQTQIDAVTGDVVAVTVVIDPDFMDDWQAIYIHELGHVYHPDWTEQQCDAQACAAGYYIHDATY